MSWTPLELTRLFWYRQHSNFHTITLRK